MLFWTIHVNTSLLFFTIKKIHFSKITNIERNECPITSIFCFKWFNHFLRAKRKISFIKSLIHAFQTRINSLSFHLCSSFNSLIMEQQFSYLFPPVWAADCILWLADICLEGKLSPVHCGMLWSRILASGFFFGCSYKSSRHTYFMRLIKCFKQSP